MRLVITCFLLASFANMGMAPRAPQHDNQQTIFVLASDDRLALRAPNKTFFGEI